MYRDNNMQVGRHTITRDKEIFISGLMPIAHAPLARHLEHLSGVFPHTLAISNGTEVQVRGTDRSS